VQTVEFDVIHPDKTANSRLALIRCLSMTKFPARTRSSRVSAFCRIEDSKTSE